MEELTDWYSKWSHRLEPKTIDILGGEPLLNKNICEIIKLTREHWPTSKIDITTNGVLLDRYPDLPKYLQKYNVGLKISKHGTNKEYNELWNLIVDFVKSWKEKYGISINLWESDVVWFKGYRGFGRNIEPFEDNDPKESWNNCITGQDCWQILDGNIYKCAPLAYLPMLNEKYKLSEKWNHYLEYKPLSPECTDEELKEFFNKKAESFCAMCPKNPQVLHRQHDPRASIRVYEI
jgi:MoaA/NifB/PqqE/SkfB family radical SAM enzyme